MERDPCGAVLTGYREGFLWKRGRDNGQYLSRKFILSEREGVLKYFNKHDVSIFTVFLSFCIANSPPEEKNLFSGNFLMFWAHFFCMSCLQAREPKAIMKINSVNATFQPSKIGTAHGLQITYLKDNSTRNIFVYHEDGKVRHLTSCIYVPLVEFIRHYKQLNCDSQQNKLN